MRWLASSAAAARTAAETFAVTRVWVIARTASRRPAVNDIRAGVASVCGWRPGIGGAGPDGLVPLDADQLGGGYPGPHFLGDLVRGRRAQDRAAGRPGVGDRGLVLADHGFHCGPPVRVAGGQLGGRVCLPVRHGGGQRVQFILDITAAAGDLHVVLHDTDRDAAGAVGQEGLIGAVRQRPHQRQRDVGLDPHQPGARPVRGSP